MRSGIGPARDSLPTIKCARSVAAEDVRLPRGNSQQPSGGDHRTRFPDLGELRAFVCPHAAHGLRERRLRRGRAPEATAPTSAWPCFHASAAWLLVSGSPSATPRPSTEGSVVGPPARSSATGRASTTAATRDGGYAEERPTAKLAARGPPVRRGLSIDLPAFSGGSRSGRHRCPSARRGGSIKAPEVDQ